MASTFSNLGFNLQGTGDNSGTWGSITNVNLQEIDNAISGVVTVTLTGNTTLAFTTNINSTTFTDEAGRNKTIILSGSLSATTVIVTVPNVEKDYVIINNSGATATISSGGSTTVSIATGFKSYVIVDASTTSVISTDDRLTNIIAVNSTVTNAVFSSTVNLTTQSELRFQDTTGGQFIGLRASTTIATSFTLNLPTANGTSGQGIVTDGSGNLSFSNVASNGFAIAMAVAL
jgi:hypothetical protein